ncbi:hypothetical protein A2154_00800 [Candidatus Gottesmanbacteria bacterium RBG_16_43_7]|uniref:ParB-like catalytic effector domain-containing protein n=1 Tax=Candidatus Gottesmanbacteria bacterium RBG_16_43_7 TaxID=1798373 RepID=A0A1F5Z960_9BACT|nr:MAG: hypothetical protein A2154_00800 [Candidatus Gottesmanbacteria bacterium RBG_16_43_7]
MEKPFLSVISSRLWDDFISALKSVTLVGDPTLLPYINSRISSRIVRVSDIKPISLYILRSKLQIQNKLYHKLLQNFQIDIFNLDGGFPEITFRLTGQKGIWRMAPPIVEISAADNNQPVLLDGEHRFYLAQQLNKPVRVIWIENVNPNYPVVSLPGDWSQIRQYSQIPPRSRKRRFRYQSLADVPDISKFSDVVLTHKNFQYFFYRDLNPICTSGIRE